MYLYTHKYNYLSKYSFVRNTLYTRSFKSFMMSVLVLWFYLARLETIFKFRTLKYYIQVDLILTIHSHSVYSCCW